MTWYKLVDKEPVECDMLDADGGLHQNRHVGRTQVGESSVSTVFLALDHSFGGGKPVLFETMVFGGELDDYMLRYCTWEQAEIGHERIVKEARAANGSFHVPSMLLWFAGFLMLGWDIGLVIHHDMVWWLLCANLGSMMFLSFILYRLYKWI